ncbi:Na+ dependent nucleoside transporter C-terminus-domain-containing protein [Hysterangium stoloniferum]|nr:Na+ dependent nucleoside transporter C-terminus-domain-containing protein [Hysterangium stoloniferum]
MSDTEKATVCPSVAVPADPRHSSSSADSIKKNRASPTCVSHNMVLSGETDEQGDASTEHRRPGNIGRVMLPALAGLVLAWWVSGLVVEATRSRWIPASLWAWFFLLVILFRFLPISIVTSPISPFISAITTPILSLPYHVRLMLLWLAAVAITFGSAFGSARPAGTSMSDRAISLAGVYFTQLLIVGMSHNKKAILWTRIPTSIILQQALALFIYKSDAGDKFFAWINAAVADFQTGAIEATAFIFDPETVAKKWFFVAGLATMIFLAAFVQMLYFFNWMQWLTKQFAWLGENILGASGAETFVALWTPFFGQVHSAILVGPYVNSMTDAELGTVMATSMSSASSLQMLTYATLIPTLPLRSLLAVSGAAIPGALINSKVAFPEDPAGPVTLTRSRTSTCANRKKIQLRKAVDLLDCLSDGAIIGLRIAGSVLTNFFSVLGLLVFVNGLLIYIFKSFHVPALDLHLVVAAPLAPFTFFLGIPRDEVWRMSYIISGKLLVSSDFAMAALKTAMASSEPFSERTLAVGGMALCNAASLGSLGSQVGVMIALAPAAKKSAICKMGIPALLVATVVTIQTTAIAANLF